METFDVLSFARLALTILPTTLNTRSDGHEVAGIAKIRFASFDRIGKNLSF